MCEHNNKAYSLQVLTIYPPQSLYICKDCGHEGTERGTMNISDYEETKRKFSKRDIATTFTITDRSNNVLNDSNGQI